MNTSEILLKKLLFLTLVLTVGCAVPKNTSDPEPVTENEPVRDVYRYSSERYEPETRENEVPVVLEEDPASDEEKAIDLLSNAEFNARLSQRQSDSQRTYLAGPTARPTICPEWYQSPEVNIDYWRNIDETTIYYCWENGVQLESREPYLANPLPWDVINPLRSVIKYSKQESVVDNARRFNGLMDEFNYRYGPDGNETILSDAIQRDNAALVIMLISYAEARPSPLDLQRARASGNEVILRAIYDTRAGIPFSHRWRRPNVQDLFWATLECNDADMQTFQAAIPEPRWNSEYREQFLECSE